MDTNLWFNIPVDESGVPHDIKFVDQENYSTQCQREALRIHQAHRYIPAFHNGSPVPSIRVHNHFSEGCSGVIEQRSWHGDERWCKNAFKSDRFLEY